MNVEEIVAKANSIEGWMSVKELGWLAQSAAVRHVIIEVGSWKGRSTKALAMGTRGYVIAVDHWKGSENERTQSHKEAVDNGPDSVFGIFQKNLADELRLGKVIPLRVSSEEAPASLPKILRGLKADLIFIDAEHTYEALLRDIKTFTPFVKPGGVLCGHDYSTAFPGVMKAVDDSFGKDKTQYDSIWIKQF